MIKLLPLGPGSRPPLGLKPGASTGAFPSAMATEMWLEVRVVAEGATRLRVEDSVYYSNDTVKQDRETIRCVEVAKDGVIELK